MYSLNRLTNQHIDFLPGNMTNYTGMDSIYDAAIEGNLLEVMLDCVAQAAPGSVVVLIGQDSLRENAGFLLHRGLPSDAVRSYAARALGHDNWLQHQWRQPVGRVYHEAEFNDRPSGAKASGYLDWLNSQSAFGGVAGVVVQRSGSRQIVIEVRYPTSRQRTFEDGIADTLRDLAPHFVRAMRIHQLRIQHPLDDERASALLELMPFPVFIVDDRCQVHNMNSKAEAVAQRMDFLFVTPDRRLYAVDPAKDSELGMWLAKIGSHPRGSQILSLEGSGESGRRIVSLTALAAGQGPLCHRVADPQERSQQRIALVVHNDVDCLGLSTDTLWRAFGLTNGESQLAQALLEGDSIADFAVKSQVSKQAVRNQLVSVMRKTGTSRQPQLVALLTRLAMSSPI